MVKLLSLESLRDLSRRLQARAGCSCIVLLLCIFATGVSPARAHLILLSTSGSAQLAGLSFEDEDLVLFDPVKNSASIFFDGGLYKKDEDTNAVSVVANGNLLLSTRSKASLGGLSFKDGDIVEYDPSTGSASKFFSENRFRGDEEINALSLLHNGNIVLSTRRNAVLGGLAFEKDDLVEYNVATGEASLFLDGDLFNRNQNIRAVHVLKNGNIALSTKKKATLGGITFGDDSIIEYDPVTDSASLLLDGSVWFSDRYQDIDALFIFEDIELFTRAAVKVSRELRRAYVSEPTTLALIGVSVLTMVSIRGKRRFVFSRRSCPSDKICAVQQSSVAFNA